MATVYLDTCVIIDEHYLRSANAQAFFKACKILDFTVVVPQLVVDEARGNFSRSLHDKFSAFRKAQKELAKQSPFEWVEFSVADHVKSFEVWLDEFLEQDHIVVAAYPNILLSDLVPASYSGKKPFKNNGEGIKDYLLWATVSAHINSRTRLPPYYFLTRNTKDFCTDGPEGSKILHPELSAQLAEGVSLPLVYLSVKDFFDVCVAPSLEGAALADFARLDRDIIEARVRGLMESDLLQSTITGFEGVPFTDEIIVSSIQDEFFEDLSIKKVGGDVIIEVSGLVSLEIDGFIEKSSFYLLEEARNNIDINDSDWNDWVMQASTTIETPFEVTLIYSPDSDEFTDETIEFPKKRENDWY